MASISCETLKARLWGTAVLLDVLPPEEYARRHLPGACNACIYEVVFLETAARLVPDRSTPIVVYDATGRTLAAPLARERLLKAGYHDVSVLEGGLAAWEAAGNPVEPAAGGAVDEPSLKDRTYRVDAEQSVLEWTGRNINNRHYGRIPLAGGEIVIRDGSLVSGSITLAMGAISNQDLQDEGYRRMLLDHLKSEDFLDVARFPTATVTLTGWEAMAGATPGTPNYTLHGTLTLKGVTRELRFPAVIIPQDDGSLKAQATIDLDRTLWNVVYGSGKLFERLGMHLVNDLINVELFIVAR
jgi:polyisoprenoid-binding protein YceI